MAGKFEKLAGEYATLWDMVQIRAGEAGKVAAAAQALANAKPRYADASGATGVPPFVIGLIHNLEGSFSFTKRLQDGATIAETDWTPTAIDILRKQGLDDVTKWTIERIAFQLESWNGFGYRNPGININTPYLWSLTNHHTVGKYVRDREFDANAPSDQVGAMALLKHLIDNEDLEVPRVGKVTPPAPPAPPVETGLFNVDKIPIQLRKSVDIAPAPEARIVFRGTSIRKIADVPGTDGKWLEVEVVRPGAAAPERGFAELAKLRPLFASSEVDQAGFAQACIDEARRFGTSAHFLIALANAETKILNVSGEGGAFGPFALTADEWTRYNDPVITGYADTDRFNPYAQPAVAAGMTVNLTEDIQAEMANDGLPTSEFLFLARLFSAKGLKGLLAAQATDTVRGAVEGAGVAASEVTGAIESHPTLLAESQTVGALRTAVQEDLDEGLVVAVKLIREVEPELVHGPSVASDGSAVPWMAKALGELGVNETANPDRITEYFSTTTLGAQPASEPWCAAFVMWCIEKVGLANKVSNRSARAADWLGNGTNLPGPQLGAIAVTRKLVPNSSGHVGFVLEWSDTQITLLGGNQGEAVTKKKMPVSDIRGWRKL